MMPTYHSFEQLDCYQKCRKLRIWIHRFLIRETIIDLDIIQNIKRAGRSTTRNIAEGFARHHRKENVRFCRISIGSIHEILEDFNIMADEELCTEEAVQPGRQLAFAALRSTQGYIKYLLNN